MAPIYEDAKIFSYTSKLFLKSLQKNLYNPKPIWLSLGLSVSSKPIGSMFVWCSTIDLYQLPLLCFKKKFFYRSMEKAMAPHSSTLAWRIPWTEEPGKLQSMGSLRVGRDWATSLWLFTFMHWRRKWQPTPVFLPGDSQGRGSLVGCRLWGHTGSDTTEATQQQQQQHSCFTKLC